MDSDRELTIVLTLKDRFPFTIRWMSYAERVRFPFPVFIADASAGDEAESLLRDETSVPGVRYQYVRYGPDRTPIDYWRRVANACMHIRTPLVALASQDDLFLVPGVRDAVQFMRGHSDYLTCGGHGAVFRVGSDGGRASAGDPKPPEALYGRRVDWKYSIEAQSLDDDSAKDRVYRRLSSDADPPFAHVQRTAELRRLAEIVCDAEMSDPCLLERLMVLLMAIAGKTRQLESLYLARPWNEPGSSGFANDRAHGDWFDRMLVTTWSRDFTTFVTIAAHALAARDRITEDEARRSIVDLYRLWLAPRMLDGLMTEPTITLPMTIAVAGVQRLLARSPASTVRRLARTFYRRSRWISVDAVHGTQLRARRVPNAEKAFTPIRQFLTGSPAEAVTCAARESGRLERARGVPTGL
jgi:glycosyltransferase domain-containing protein